MSLLFASPPRFFSTSPKNNLFLPRSPLSLSSPFTTFTTCLRSSSSSSSFSFDSTSSSDDSPNPSSGPEPEPISSGTDVPDADPPRSQAEGEWGTGNDEEGVGFGNGSVGEADDRRVVDNGMLIRCLVDTVYGTELGFRASAEVRAEVLELVNQLEVLNPNPSPVENPGLLDGNWVLL
ncbi:putative plastid-lipid-associated protein 3, chloroplastic [Drosera capensis]